MLLLYLNPYTFHITPYDLAFLGTIFIGLTFVLQLWFTKRINRAANRFLALALATIVLWMVWVLAIDIRLGNYFPRWSWLPLHFSLALGPLIYFYVLKITCPQYKFRWKDLLYFSPLLLELGAQLLEIKESVRTGAAAYETQTFHYVNPVLQVLAFFSVIIYLYYSFRLIERFYRRLKFNDVSDRYRYELRWLRNLLIGFSLLWLLWIPFTAADYFYYHNQLSIHAYYPLYLLLAVMAIRMAAAAFLRPEVGAPVPAIPVSKPAALKQKGIWLKKAMEVNLFYQDAELNLRSLAEKLDIHPHELSRIVNEALKKNFNDFINEYRIREVARKMEDPAYGRLTLLGIAFDSGFNSKTTFNRTFRQMIGKSPAEYKNELKKERPTYHLEPYSRSSAIILHHEATPGWSFEKLNRNYMFKNYLKIAWRNLIGNKVYSGLNIVGLAAGMAVALLIGLWVANEFSYDKFLSDHQQIYQVEMSLTSQHDGEQTQVSLALPLTDILRKEIPGIKYVSEADYLGWMNHGLLVGDKKLYLGGGAAQSDFFKIFQYPFIKGNATSALAEPYSIVLTQSTAKALFGNADPMNKLVRYDNAQSLKVTGVIKDLPKNSTLQFAYLTPFSFKEQTEGWMKGARSTWTNDSFTAYLELEPGVTYAEIGPKIKNIVYEHSPQMRAGKPVVVLHALDKWHLYGDFKNGKEAGGFIDYVRMFSIIGVLVLIIACINFMNMSTARSEKRAREVGVRKAMGSQRQDLIFQFLMESILITFISFLLSLLFVQLALPAFNQLTGGSLSVPYLSPLFWVIMIAFVLSTGLMAGSRPAFYLSSFNPVKVLKGSLQVGKAGTLPRKILVVIQFSCSIALIISTIIIYQQIQHAKSRPAGYSADRLVMTDMGGDLNKHYAALKNDLLASGAVESVTTASSPVTNIYSHLSLDKWPGKDAGEESVNVEGIWVASDYFHTLGMTLVQGHDFSPNVKADSLNVIVNEATIKRTGLKDPVNQLITWNGNNRPVKIIGVVKDALMESPFTPVAPAIFASSSYANSIMYRLSKNMDRHIAIEKVGKIFNAYNPAYPYIYKFTDDEYNQKFSLEVLVGKLAGIFAGLAIFISCLGLFGLAAYVAEQRTREIGIRKVLGASVSQVWVLLSWDFVLLVIISCGIASPLALYFLSNWLQKYDYRISIGPGVFVLAALAALAITIITVSFQAIKAALANPVESLRSE
jgi:ABC-type antimicrobial peptide transport system permease subunit/AraC-like DNA-binding protein